MEGIWSSSGMVPVRGNSERTIGDLHMSGGQRREGIDHEEGIEEGVHIALNRVVRRRVKGKSDPS